MSTVRLESRLGRLRLPVELVDALADPLGAEADAARALEGAGVTCRGRVRTELVPLVEALHRPLLVLALDEQLSHGWRRSTAAAGADSAVLLVPDGGEVEVLGGHPSVLPGLAAALVGLSPRSIGHLDQEPIKASAGALESVLMLGQSASAPDVRALTGLNGDAAATLAAVAAGVRRRWRLCARGPRDGTAELLHMLDDGDRLWAVLTDDDHARVAPVTATLVWDALVTLLAPTSSPRPPESGEP